MAEFEREGKVLDDELAAERVRQQKEAQRKLSERRQTRQRELNRKQQEERKRELEAQEATLSALKLNEMSSGASSESAAGGGASSSSSSSAAAGAPSGAAASQPLLVPNVAKAGLSQSDVESLNREHEQRLEELRARHEAERIREEQRLAEESEKERLRKEREDELSRQREMVEKKAEWEAKQQAAKTAGDAQRILEEHERELAVLSSTVAAEHDKQAAELKRRTEEKRQRREKELKRKQDEELQKALEEKRQAEDELLSKKQQAAEREAISSAISSNVIPVERADEAIEIVLQARHSKETQALISRQRDDRGKALAAMEYQQNVAFEERKSDLQEQLTADRKKAAGSESRLRQVEEQGKRLAREAEEEHVRHVAQAREETGIELDVRQAQERLDLRQRQLDEIAAACEELSPQQTILKIQGLEASKRSRELAEFQKSLEGERTANREKMEGEKKRIEFEQKALMNLEMATFQKELDEERQRMESAIDQERHKREQMMADLRVQKQKEKEAELALHANLQEEQKAAILKIHEQDIELLIDAMEAERQMQEELVRKKIAEKQSRKMLKKQREIDEQAAREAAERRERQAKVAEQQLKTEEQWSQNLKEKESTVRHALLRMRSGMLKASPRGGLKGSPDSPLLRGRDVASNEDSRALPAAPQPMRVQMVPMKVDIPEGQWMFPLPPEKEWFDLLQRSPLFQKLLEVEAMVERLRAENEAGMKSRVQSITVLHRAGEERSQMIVGVAQAFRDILEGKKSAVDEAAASEWAFRDPTDRLLPPPSSAAAVPVNPDDLPLLQSVMYRFCLLVRQIAIVRCGFRKCDLVVVSQLPSAAAAQNGKTAFRSSYYYDASASALLVRKERLSSVGDAAVVVCHGLAHVQSGVMNSDANGVFLMEFHRCLRAVLDELFLTCHSLSPPKGSRAFSSTAADSLVGDLFNALPTDEARRAFADRVRVAVDEKVMDMS